MSSYTKQFTIFSKPFIDAAKDVFETMVFTSLKTGKPIVKKGLQSKGEVSTYLKISGVHNPTKKNYLAMLSISWPKETYLKLSSAMLMEEITQYNDECSDIGEEIIKMILGNAKKDLTGLGFSSYVDESINNQNNMQGLSKDSHVIEIPIECSYGKMFMEIYYTDALEL
ncbi:MAG: chemotaxis protein CheX [Bacteriovoracaceae bacterium]